MNSKLTHPMKAVFMPVFIVTITIFAQPVKSLTIPDVPLQAVTSAEPNIMMLLDDSGSMHWEITPDDILYTYYMYPRASGIYGSTDYSNSAVDTNGANKYVTYLRSSNNNKSYYNPAVRYRPWSNPNGTLWVNANPAAALHNPARPGAGSRNLTVDNTQSATWINNDGSSTTQSRTFFPATYFVYNSGNVWSPASYTRIEVKPATTSYTKAPGRTDCAGTTCTYNEEIQNFANWYSYYRSRILTARAGIGRAFAAQGEKIRVGFGAINKAASSIDGVSTRTVVRGVRLFSGTDRSNFFSDLYDYVMVPSNTPLRRALDDAGVYYSRTDSRGPWSTTPGVIGGTDLTCRQSYTILMTDGYWNDAAASTSGARLNVDNTGGPTITGPNSQSYTYSAVTPFKDSWSDSVADVAMYYWKNDLYPGLANEVPTSYLDPAFWQHMVTFGVSLGVTGSVNPTLAFDAIRTGATINWPQPNTNPGKLDDLLHAGVNSRGGFFSAQNPEEFAGALGDVLNAISQRTGSAASIAANSTSIMTNSKVFNAKFDTSKWSGELEALPVSNQGVSSTASWLASEHFPAPNDRKIFTRSGINPVAFKWTNLNAVDQAALGSADVVEYLRGVRTNEAQNGGAFRNRTNILGDLVNSTPAYVADTDTVFIGSNDGMLHAFNGATGIELFGYIPSQLIPKLKDLSEPSYAHTYFVDGDTSVSSQVQTPGKNYLIGSLGRGAKGLYGLDVTTPAAFTSGNVLWEYSGASDPDFGNAIGTPVIAKMNNGSVVAIVSNGYSSTNGNAVLYVFDLVSGAVIKKIDTGVGGDNGLATPGVFDNDDDGDIDVIYAGDLKGNVWKFDVSDGAPANWDVAFRSGPSALPLFVAMDASSNRQPITTQITVSKNDVSGDTHYGKRFLFFGTGSYFKTGDAASTSVQSWYGLIDENSQISARSSLRQRTIIEEGSVSSLGARAFSVAATDDMVGMKGWYVDLIKSNGIAEGERMVTPSRVYSLAEPTLIASSIIPIDDPCKPGGLGYVNAINPYTGARLTFSFFDMNSDHDFTNDALSSGASVGSVNLNIGMTSEPRIIGDQLVVGGSSGIVASLPVNTGAGGGGGANRISGRLMWREIVRD